MAGSNRTLGRRIFPVCLVLTCLLSGACSCREKAQRAPETASVSPVPNTTTETTTAHTTTTASFRVVTLSGEPLAGIVPIATVQPNAFDEPIARGPATNASGESRLRFPGDRRVFLRAWDPELRYFPNNYYEAMPNTGDVTETLLIAMVQSATLEAALILPDGRPAAGENAGLMMLHPALGPWWPSEADTGDRGEVVFRRVPAGSYTLRIKVASGPTLEIPETSIPPGAAIHLGFVYLQ